MQEANLNWGDKALLDFEDLKRITGLSRPTVYQLLNRADMPVVSIGRRKFMNAELFRKWLNRQATGEEEKQSGE